MTESRAVVAAAPTARSRPGELLCIEGMSKRFGETVALAGLDLDVRAGEFFTVIGPSGSGKTTLLRIVGGFEDADSAERFELAGVRMSGVPANRRNVTTVFQHYGLFPHMTVGKNVEYGLKIRGVTSGRRRERAYEALRMVRLDRVYDRSVGRLSGGERQRVALARAIVTEPALLLLDEPLGALDEKLRLDMQFELKELQRSLGIAFLYITHNQDEALTLSDRLAVLHLGVLQQIGTPGEVYTRPANRFVAEFMGSSNELEATFVRFEGEGLASVEISGAIFEASIATGVHVLPGTRVWITTRPEHVTVDTEPSELATLRATRSSTAYRGSFQEAEYQLEEGAVIRARQSTMHAEEFPAVGYVGLRKEATVLLLE